MEFYKYMAGLHGVRKNVGKVMIIPMNVELDSFSTFRIIYTCGEVEIKKGGSIKIGIPDAFSTPQFDNPSGEGYVRIIGLLKNHFEEPQRLQECSCSSLRT